MMIMMMISRGLGLKIGAYLRFCASEHGKIRERVGFEWAAMVV